MVHLEWFLSHKKKNPSSYAVCHPWTLSVGEPRTLRGNRSCSSWVAPPARLPTQPPAATAPSVAVQASRPGGSNGNHCIQCGCGLYRGGTYPESHHHWGSSGGGNGESTKPGIIYQKPQGAQLLDQQSCGPCSLESKLFWSVPRTTWEGDMKPDKDFNEVLWQCRIANGLDKKLKLKKWKLALHN